MNKSCYFLAPFVLFFTFVSVAGNGINYAAQGKPTKDWLYKSINSKDINLEVERIGDAVLLHLYSQSMWSVENIYIEKSKDPTDGFVRCKSVKVADNLAKSKTYISVADEMPYPSNVDCYYRLRTVSPSGSTKIHPVVSLAPIFIVEPMETVEK